MIFANYRHGHYYVRMKFQSFKELKPSPLGTVQDCYILRIPTLNPTCRTFSSPELRVLTNENDEKKLSPNDSMEEGYYWNISDIGLVRKFHVYSQQHLDHVKCNSSASISEVPNELPALCEKSIDHPNSVRNLISCCNVGNPL